MVRGYALSGGGRGIERVDVSVDGGGHWEEAVRLPQVKGREYSADEGAEREKWAWVLWEHRTVLHPPCQIVVKAVRKRGRRGSWELGARRGDEQWGGGGWAGGQCGGQPTG